MHVNAHALSMFVGGYICIRSHLEHRSYLAVVDGERVVESEDMRQSFMAVCRPLVMLLNGGKGASGMHRSQLLRRLAENSQMSEP